MVRTEICGVAITQRLLRRVSSLPKQSIAAFQKCSFFRSSLKLSRSNFSYWQISFWRPSHISQARQIQSPCMKFSTTSEKIAYRLLMVNSISQGCNNALPQFRHSQLSLWRWRNTNATELNCYVKIYAYTKTGNEGFYGRMLIDWTRFSIVRLQLSCRLPQSLHSSNNWHSDATYTTVG